MRFTGGGHSGRQAAGDPMMKDFSSGLVLSECRVTVILNAKAGKRDGDNRLREIRERLAPLAGRLEVRTTQGGAEIGELARRAADEGSDVIAALGGDGTQSAVAQAVAGSGVVMAVLPGGTFNYFARELGVEEMDTAVAALSGGRVTTRDVGRINDRIFLNNASFGLYPRILQRREAIYRRWGRSRLAAYWSVLAGLSKLRDPMRLSVDVNGIRHEFATPLAFVARSAFQLENLGMDGVEAVRAGHFALFAAKGESRLALLATSLRLAFGFLARHEDFDLVISDSLSIEVGAGPRLIALDGEKVRMEGPFELEVLHDALQVIVPAETPEGAAKDDGAS